MIFVNFRFDFIAFLFNNSKSKTAQNKFSQAASMNLPLEQIFIWLASYKYLALFPLALVEGPIVTVIMGFFSSLGFINLLFAFLIIVAGDLTGDGFFYILGRKGGKKFIQRWGRFLGVKESQVESLEKNFTERGGRILIIGKILHGVGGAFLLAAGLAKMPFDKFLFFNLLATLVKSSLLIALGFYFGQAFNLINFYLGRIALITVAATAIFLLIYFLYFRKKRDDDLIK